MKAPDFYRSLPPMTQLVAQCYGVVHPIALARSSVVRLCASADIRYEGRRLTQEQAKTATKTLLNAGFAHRGHNQLVSLDSAWALPMTIAARRQGTLEAIFRAYEKEQPRYGHYMSPDRLEMLARYCAVNGRFRELDSISSLPSSAWRFLAYDETGELIAALPDGHREAAMAACLNEVIENLRPAEHVINTCTRSATDAANFADDIAFYHILQGRFDDAERTFSDLPEKMQKTKRVLVGQAATLALMATLRGDDEQAMLNIDRACELEKSGTRKRNVFPTSRALSLSLLSLVRLDTPQSTERFNQLLRAAQRNEVFPWLIRFAEWAQAARANTLYGAGLHSESSLQTVLVGMVQCWLIDSALYRVGEIHGGLFRTFERALENGYLWAAAETGTTIQRLTAHLSESDQVTTGNMAETAAKAASVAHDLHAQLGTSTLATLGQPLAPWERAIKDLELLAYETNKKSNAKKKKPSSSVAERLAWELEISPYGHPSVTPKLQRAIKSGGWTKGKAVANKRLAAEAGSIDCLIDQDRAVIATIKRDFYSRGSYYLDAAAVYQLAGHPHVVSTSGAPIEVVRRDPELTIHEVDGKAGEELVARLEPFGDEDERYIVMMAGDSRCEVTRFNASHQRLRDIIPPEGLKLPRNAQTRLIEAVTALASEVRIQSSLSGNSSEADTIEGDARPWVQLLPSGEGLTVSLVVEPAPGSAQFFTPGQGGANVYAPVADGRVMAVRRDLQAERAQLDLLLNTCRALPPGLDPSEPFTLPQAADCLELLEQLEQAEIRCAWPGGEPFKIVARAEASQLRINIKSAAEWFSASAELVVDESQVLNLKRLFELMDASPGTRFLELDAGQFLVLTDSFRRQLDELKSFSTPAKGGAVRIHPLAAGLLDDVVADSDVRADQAWRDQCARFRDAQAIEANPPSTLQAELRPYQVEGFKWLAQLSEIGAGACLADDMGLGKTVQALALLLHRATGGPAIVVAPTSVAANWVKEARRFAPTLNVIEYTGERTSRASRLDSLSAFDLVVTTYGLLQNDIERLAGIAWHSAILDEAQAIKNLSTKRARAAFELNAAFRAVTTGTPIQNNLMDLYALFRFINPGMLGSAAEYQRRYLLPIERDGDATTRARLNRLIAPFVLRRLKPNVLDDLPPRTEITLEVEMSAAEAAFYEALRQRAAEDLANAAADKKPGEHHIEVLAHLTRLRLACCNPQLVQAEGAPASSKLATFAEVLDELLENRHKVLVFSQFVKHLKLVEAHVKAAGIRYQYLDGQTPPRARQQRINAFQAGEGDVFLISLKAGGTGLNLTAADYVIHLDPWWNPAVEDQASDRAHRIGQSRPVTIYRLVTKGTIEAQIVNLHRRKRDLAEQLLEGTDAPARLKTEELLALLA